MAVRKATRSNPPAQPNSQRTDSPNKASMTDPQLKAQLFGTIAHLNRGFGIALAAFDRLRKQDRRQRPGAFSQTCLNDFRSQTETLRAQANRDLLRLIAAREDYDAERFARLCDHTEQPKPKHRL